MAVDISTAICTYNRAELLSKALESLCRQTLTPDLFEVLIIDNGSEDHTQHIVTHFQESFPSHHITYFYESRSGVSHARNKAAREAQGRYIAYLDDDASAIPVWLEEAWELIQLFNSPACIGGPIYPRYEAQKPFWFQDQYETRSWGDTVRDLKPGEAFSGSNMIWRRDVLLSLGGFPLNAGPIGKSFTLGEDTMTFRRLWQSNPEARVVYSPRLMVYHSVPEYKMRISYLLKRAFVSGQSEIRMRERPSLAWRTYMSLRCSGSIVVHVCSALFRLNLYSNWQNWLVEEGRLVFTRAGTALAALGIYYKIRQD